MPRDYLTNLGQNTSHFSGSRYARMLAQLGTPSRTWWRPTTCPRPPSSPGTTPAASPSRTPSRPAMPRRHPVRPGAGPRRLSAARKRQQAGRPRQPLPVEHGHVEPLGGGAAPHRRDDASRVRVDRPRDRAPRSARPDRLGSRDSRPRTGRRQHHLAVELGAPRSGDPGQRRRSRLARRDHLRDPPAARPRTGTWRTVAAAPSSVGDGPGAAPFLLATLPGGTSATAVRVLVAKLSSAWPGGRLSPRRRLRRPAFVQILGPGAGP